MARKTTAAIRNAAPRITRPYSRLRRSIPPAFLCSIMVVGALKPCCSGGLTPPQICLVQQRRVLAQPVCRSAVDHLALAQQVRGGCDGQRRGGRLFDEQERGTAFGV